MTVQSASAPFLVAFSDTEKQENTTQVPVGPVSGMGIDPLTRPIPGFSGYLQGEPRAEAPGIIESTEWILMDR